MSKEFFHNAASIYEARQESLDRNHRCFLGQILTIIDASISDPRQAKAVKDLIKDSSNLYLGGDLTFNLARACKEISELPADKSMEGYDDYGQPIFYSGSIDSKTSSPL